MVLKAGVLTVLGNVQWEIQRWFYSLWAHIMNPRQSLVVPNVSVIKCIFMEEKIQKCCYIRLYQYAFVQRISVVRRNEFMALRKHLASGCILGCSIFYDFKIV